MPARQQDLGTFVLPPGLVKDDRSYVQPDRRHPLHDRGRVKENSSFLQEIRGRVQPDRSHPQADRGSAKGDSRILQVYGGPPQADRRHPEDNRGQVKDDRSQADRWILGICPPKPSPPGLAGFGKPLPSDRRLKGSPGEERDGAILLLSSRSLPRSPPRNSRCRCRRSRSRRRRRRRGSRCRSRRTASRCHRRHGWCRRRPRRRGCRRRHFR